MPRFLAVLVLSITTVAAMSQTPLKSVDHVDLQRYVGTWYELARTPNWFEKKCDRDVTATYAVQGEGISVTNICIKKDGSSSTSRGKAKVVDRSTNAKLKVTFFWPFYGDYWIIGLDKDYKWAIVGEPKRKYLWILSRTPSLPETEMKEILRQIDASGYRSADLVQTQQSKAAK